jgi:hypothetical protein
MESDAISGDSSGDLGFSGGDFDFTASITAAAVEVIDESSSDSLTVDDEGLAILITSLKQTLIYIYMYV